MVAINMDTSHLRKVLNDLMKECKDPSKELKGVGRIVEKAVRKNFDTHGAYFGDSWPGISGFMAKVRKWQGYTQYPSKGPLDVTGTLKNSWITKAEGKTRVVVGSETSYANKLQNGVPGTATFKQKNGGKSWTHTFNKVRSFPILPSSGRLPNDVITDITKKLQQRLQSLVK